MESLEQIKTRVEAAVSGAKIDIIPNPGPSQQSSLLIDNEHADAVVKFLRDDPALRLDFCSNATGVDWRDRKAEESSTVREDDDDTLTLLKKHSATSRRFNNLTF